MLWAAFIGLALLTVAGVAATIAVLQMEQRRAYALNEELRPLLDEVRRMDEALSTMVSASRAYVITGETAFVQQYKDGSREFDIASSRARALAGTGAYRSNVEKLVTHQRDVKEYTDAQIETRSDASVHVVGVLRRDADDYAERIADQVRADQRAGLERAANLRQWLMMGMVLLGVIIIGLAAAAVSRIQDRLGESLIRQVRRTEAMIGGMSDGVLLVDGEGNSVFINPAGQRLLGKSEVGVPIYKQAEVYRLRDEHGRKLDPQELPAAQALSTGRLVQDVTVLIAREGAERVAVSMR